MTAALDGPSGYDPSFLAADLPVPLPRPAEPLVAVLELACTHFTVLLRPDRRLAAVTGVNIDGASLLDLDRAGEQWHPDPRAPSSAQTDDGLYADNAFDRGHLVRRRDPVWGPPGLAAQANTETFRFPNCAPQAASFNQGKELWLGLEDYLLTTASSTGSRLSVFTAPVLADDDPMYRGVQIPRQFWKVAAWMQPTLAPGSGADPSSGLQLAATGYLLDQSDLLDDLLRAGLQPPANDLLGAYRAYQVPVAELAARTGLALGPAPDGGSGGSRAAASSAAVGRPPRSCAGRVS